MSYNVVFVYTRVARGYEGVITWTAFDSKKAFDLFYTEKIKERNAVVVEGVTVEECVRQTNLTPRERYESAAAEDATDPKTGLVDEEILKLKLFAIDISFELKKMA